MSDHQCLSCGGFCPKSGCKRLDTNQSLSVMELISELKYWNGPLAEICITKLKEQRDEIINLKAYAMHERSLGAEPFAQENHDLRQEVECLKAALDSTQTAENAGLAAIERKDAALRVALEALMHYQYGGSSYKEQADKAITTIKESLA